jgi:hypothetical protein
VSQEFLDVLGVDVAGEEQGGAGVPEFVETGTLWQLGAPQESFEGTREVAVFERRAYGGGEDETVVPPEGTTPLSPMSAQPEIPSSSYLTSRPDPTVWSSSCVAFATISMKLLTAGGSGVP